MKFKSIFKGEVNLQHPVAFRQAPAPRSFRFRARAGAWFLLDTEGWQGDPIDLPTDTGDDLKDDFAEAYNQDLARLREVRASLLLHQHNHLDGSGAWFTQRTGSVHVYVKGTVVVVLLMPRKDKLVECKNMHWALRLAGLRGIKERYPSFKDAMVVQCIAKNQLTVHHTKQGEPEDCSGWATGAFDVYRFGSVTQAYDMRWIRTPRGEHATLDELISPAIRYGDMRYPSIDRLIAPETPE